VTSALNHRYPAIQGELEAELETEDEYEDELEDEYEDELEDELEDEFEDEAFLGALGGIARGIGGLLGGDSEEEGELEEEFEFEFEAEAENEAELEDEDEDESEAFVNPVRRIYRDAELMAHLARKAAEVEGEAEAEAFIGALVPIAARLIPRAAALVSRNGPALIRGATRIARRLRRDPRMRRYVQTMPVVLQRTCQSLADQAAAGHPVTAQTAVRTLARMTGRVLGTPQSCRRAISAVGVFDRRYRRRAATAARGYRGGAAGAPAYGRRRRIPASRATATRRTTGAVPRARRRAR
jgi:hypothetical protein